MGRVFWGKKQKHAKTPQEITGMKPLAPCSSLQLLLFFFVIPALQVIAETETEPKELVQLRNAWQEERRTNLNRLDQGYLEGLRTMKVRLEKAGDGRGAAAVQMEIEKQQVAITANVARLPVDRHAAASSGIRDEGVSALNRVVLMERLRGKIWRVDHEGEGLRWYYFAEGGRLARKSKLTEWRWTALDGTWEVAPNGTVVVRSSGQTVQVMLGAEGQTQIALNHEGKLVIRPILETDLEYPGGGHE